MGKDDKIHGCFSGLRRLFLLGYSLLVPTASLMYSIYYKCTAEWKYRKTFSNQLNVLCLLVGWHSIK